MTDYNYSIATDFTSLDVAGVVHLELLRKEVADSAIASGLPLLDVKCADDTVTFVFTGTLTSGDETILDGIVAAHTGTWPGSSPGEGPPNYYEVSATGTTSTTSLTYVDLDSMVIEDVTAGKWLATFSSSANAQDDGQFVEFGITVNDVIQAASEKSNSVHHKEDNYTMHTQAFLDLSDGDTVKVRYRSEKADKYVQFYNRSLILVRLE